jgi:diguanylate cyclase (GGDEF)-like protein/PAS domain S-box-containing protein
VVLGLRHEFDLLRRLEEANVVRVLDLQAYDGGLVMLMEDAGQHDLSWYLGAGPVSLELFFEFGRKLADLLETLARHGVMHRDLSPANVVVDARKHLTLVDFESATDLQSLADPPERPAETLGTLAYQSPERTGRTGRKVDHRTDFYSVGAIFYHLLTGRPPFAAADPLEMVHCHLARCPIPPHRVTPQVPEQLSVLCMKLLEKEPEARYQTAWALRRDLAEAAQLWRTRGQIDVFPLGQGDVPETLRISDKLYGRARELAALRALLSDSSSGKRRLAFITGPAGIGKSALVEHLQPEVAARRGTFLSGKFTQMRRGQPFAALIEVCERLSRQLLTLPEDRLGAWRERLTRAVGRSGRLLTDLVPHLSALLGPQPPLPELAPAAARNRFTEVFLALFRACAWQDHPLVLFLDDVQWADPESLGLLTRLSTDSDTAFLLLVLAYRDKEIGPGHPLWTLIEEVSGEEGTRSIAPGSLTEADLVEMLHETLGAPRATVEPLARALVLASGGNPFDLRRTVHELAAEHLIEFDRTRRIWVWDLAAIRARAPTGAGAAMLLLALERLPDRTRELLSVAACIGDTAPLALLADFAQESVSSTARALWPAVRAGLLSALGEIYRFPLRGNGLEGPLSEVDAVYRFVHDRVRIAAYRRLDPRQRANVHLAIGRRLRRSADVHTTFKAADHLNCALRLICDPEERLELAKLDLQVGRAAKGATAYSSALKYLALGMRCLPHEQAWQEHPELTFELHRERAECAYLTGRHSLAESLVKEALAHTRELSRRADLANVRIVAATLAGEYARAIDVAVEALAPLGVDLPRRSVQRETLLQLQRVESLLGEKEPEAILSAAPASRREPLLALEILSNLLSPAFLGEPELLGFVTGKMVEMSLAHGHSLHSGEAYAAFAFVFGGLRGDHTREHAIGKVGVELARRYGSPSPLCRTLYIFGNHTNHWHASLSSSLPLLRESFQGGAESGELQYAAYALSGMLHAHAALGLPLPELSERARECEHFARKAGQPTTVYVAAAYRLDCSILQGELESEDPAWEEHERSAPDATALCQAEIRVLRHGFLLGQRRRAEDAAAKSGALLGHIQGMFPIAEHHFFAGLLSTRHARGSDLGTRREAKARAAPHLATLTQLARHCPENFLHRKLLLEAELARLEGQDWQALRKYSDAMERARVQGFEVDHALANELAGEFFADREQWRYAAIHLQTAYERYRRWGAEAKLRRMERDHAPLLEATPGQPEDISSSGVRSVDTLELLRASQAISQRLALPDLLRTLLQIILKLAGAERGYLLLDSDGELLVRARGSVQEGVMLVAQAAAHCVDLPQSVIEFVHRSGETLVLEDAASRGLFVEDPAVRARRVRSVLCAPLRRQNRTVGVLYVENNLTPYAFTPARVNPLRHLAVQAAISLENSALVEELQRNQELYSTLAEHFPNGAVYLLDQEHQMLVAEGRGLAEVGLKPEDLVGRTPKDAFGWGAGSQFEALVELALEGEDAGKEIAYRGRLYHVQVAPIRDARDRVVLALAMAQDVTERRTAEEQARLAAKVFESSAEAIVITDAERRVVLVNRAFGKLLGYEPEEVLGRRSDLFGAGALRSRELSEGLRKQNRWQGELWLRRKDGTEVPLWLAVTTTHDREGKLTHYVAIASDISERKAAEERIRFLAYYDALTGLPNRRLLQDRLRLAVALAQRNGHRVGVLFLDLDRFKHVNDSLGHAAGDRLLERVAQRLAPLLREGDTISRFGGDEFIVVLSETEGPVDAAHVAENILAAFTRPFLIDGQQIRTSASVGISLFPDDASGPDALIKHADSAMYHAKAHGRNKYQFFTADLNARAHERLFIENALAHAVAHGQLVLHYQPQVDAKTGHIVGAEALIRWRHPERGLILPNDFIPVAEETGQVVELGEWALRTACHQNRSWQNQGLPPISVAVNLAAEHFRQPDFSRRVTDVLQETGLAPRWLELELTERTVMEDAETTTRTLRKLKQSGVSVSIDDFGTGYSSLAYLKSFPIDKLKIDQSFVRDVTEYPDDAIITRSIIALGHNLRLQVVAEGVESSTHMDFLRDEGCDALQGFYVGFPLPADEFAPLLRRGVCPGAPHPPP